MSLNTEKYTYSCKICSTKSMVSGRYMAMDYVRLQCCSVSCKKKIIKNILKSKKEVAIDLIDLIIDYS